MNNLQITSVIVSIPGMSSFFMVSEEINWSSIANKAKRVKHVLDLEFNKTDKKNIFPCCIYFPLPFKISRVSFRVFYKELNSTVSVWNRKSENGQGQKGV